MLFYKVTATIDDPNWEEKRESTEREARAADIESSSREFNQEHSDKAYCCVSSIGRDSITCGMIAGEPDGTERHFHLFFKAIGVRIRNLKMNEITLSAMRRLLACAYHNDYIEDDDTVLEAYGLDKITGNIGYRLGFGETVLDPVDDSAPLYRETERQLATDTLTPELDRIYGGKTRTKAFGHPVHYFVETDNHGTRKALCTTLLQALYHNKRLISRRFCYLDIEVGERFPAIAYDALYRSCIGGAVVVRYLPNEDSQESDHASGELSIIELLCEVLRKYRNQVLTVFCLPRVCEKTRKLFTERLGSTGMVEIRENLTDAAGAATYLKRLCKDERIRPDKALCAPLKEGKEYLPDDLRAIFDNWYNRKIKTSVFPQYKDIAACHREAIREVARGTAYDDLRNMIGLQSAKEVIDKALAYYKMQRVYKDKGIPQDKPAMHMVFTGNPGTAKTTVARLFARIMKENGLLSKGHLVEVGRGDLVGRYVGWTAKTVEEKFKSAMGGVLFIDEAYSLVDDRSGSFGDEAINTIVQEMENRREDLVVILAGYPNEMQKFLDRNPGLRSRIAFHVPFADYDADELCDIARMIGKQKGITLTDAAIEKLHTVFDAMRLQPDFGNGRYVRNVIELSRMNQATRLMALDPEKMTETVLRSIEAADIEVPAVQTAPPKPRIGFAS